MEPPPPMADYYKRIVSMAQRKRDHTESLRMVTDIVCEKALREAQNNIEIAAKNYHDFAYIFIYDRRAIFRGVVTYHSIICPSDAAIENYRTCKVQTVLERLQSMLAPFQVQVGVCHGTQDDERSLWAITVHWITEESEVAPTAMQALPSAQLVPIPKDVHETSEKEHANSMESLGMHESSP